MCSVNDSGLGFGRLSVLVIPIMSYVDFIYHYYCFIVADIYLIMQDLYSLLHNCLLLSSPLTNDRPSEAEVVNINVASLIIACRKDIVHSHPYTIAGQLTPPSQDNVPHMERNITSTFMYFTRIALWSIYITNHLLPSLELSE